MNHEDRRCAGCGMCFKPDPRCSKRQRYCSSKWCRTASKAASQKRWLAKPKNRNYWRGPEHGERVRAWRARQRVLQDECATAEKQRIPTELAVSQELLQDECLLQNPLILGLISMVTGAVLQDEMAAAGRRLIEKGAMILRNGHQVRRAPRTPAEVSSTAT